MRAKRPKKRSAGEPVRQWEHSLRPVLKASPGFPKSFLGKMRSSKLTFGRRVHCPFLRPFFLTPAEEARVRRVSETIAALAERVTAAALRDEALFSQFHLRPEEARLARMTTGYGPASTSSRLDAFLLPNSLMFTEYNGESPAGAGYSETLSDIFRETPIMRDFQKTFEVHSYPLIAKLLDALVQTYVDWGGTTHKPQMAIVDWKDVPTWSEFEILKERFEKMGIPVLLATPEELDFDGKHLAARGKKIDLLYRRVLINDIIRRPRESEALVKGYQAGHTCVANNFRCKIPHVKAFFAVLTDRRNAHLFSSEEREIIDRHVPWTRIVRDVRSDHYGTPIELLKHIQKHRKNLVLKPSDEYGGKGVTLGWKATAKEWEKAIEAALPRGEGEEHACWIVQEKIPMRREPFPTIVPGGKVEFQKMLVDFAPYLFRGKLAGFLTRLSTTDLANVTSGGGQIPSFRVEPKKKKKARVNYQRFPTSGAILVR